MTRTSPPTCRENAKVVVADLSDKGQETVDLIVAATKDPSSAVFKKTDVSKEADCKAVVDLAVSKYGGLHVMFNNAGIMHSDVRRKRTSA